MSSVAADLSDSEVSRLGPGADIRGPGECEAVTDEDRDVGVCLQLAVVLAHVLGQEASDDQVSSLGSFLTLRSPAKMTRAPRFQSLTRAPSLATEQGRLTLSPGEAK